MSSPWDIKSSARDLYSNENKSVRHNDTIIANSVDPDQTFRSVASDLDLHCLIWRIYPAT